MLDAVLAATFMEAAASPPTVPGTAEATPATGPAVTVATAPDDAPPIIAPDINVAEVVTAHPAAATMPCAAMAAAARIVSIVTYLPPLPSTVNANVRTEVVLESPAAAAAASRAGDGGYPRKGVGVGQAEEAAAEVELGVGEEGKVADAEGVEDAEDGADGVAAAVAGMLAE